LISSGILVVILLVNPYPCVFTTHLQVLNVDGCIGALFLDLLASSGAFTKKVGVLLKVEYHSVVCYDSWRMSWHQCVLAGRQLGL
jgi:hypothetical protein